MPVVNITTDPFDLDQYEQIECDVLTDCLRERFPIWPEHARIYHQVVSKDCDITPNDEWEVVRLDQLEGPFYVVVYPGSALVIAIIAIAVAVISAVAFLVFLKPTIPSNNQQQGSQNNALSDRSNQARPNQRIEDIFGQVRSILTLLAVPYKIFINNQEVEIGYMAIGRGEYEIEDVKDGDTLIGNIAGSGVEFYGPYTSPNSGSPQLQIGTDIDQPLLSIVKMNDVNGQTLRPPNSNYVQGKNNIRFDSPDTIETNDSSVDFTNFFDTDDVITVSNANFGGNTFYDNVLKSAVFHPDKSIVFDDFDPSSLFYVGEQMTLTNAVFTNDNVAIDLSGDYTIASVDSTTMVLSE